MHQNYLNSQISWTDSQNNYYFFLSRVFALFQVPVKDIIENKFQWLIQHQLPPYYVDTWYYWEFEIYIKLLNEKNKEENEQREKQEQDQNDKYSGFNPSSFNPSSMMPKFNGGNDFSMPRF